MSTHPVRGKTIRWTFKDGPMAGKTFEHSFHIDGSLDWRPVEDGAAGKKSHADKYEVAKLSDDVYAVSYLGPAGYTLTVGLNFEAGSLVAFSSNESSLGLQNGTFSVQK